MSLMARIKGRVTTLLGHKLSGRAKRQFVLASLFGRLSDDKDKIDIGIATKLNQVMSLTASDQQSGALMIPIRLSRVMWKDGDETLELDPETLDTVEVRKTAAKIVDTIPGWLRYCDVDGMCSDVEELLRCKKRIST